MNEEILARNISQRLDSILQQKGWSTYKLAQECPASHNSIYNVVNGRTSARIDTLAYICETLGISLREFFSYQPGHTLYLSESERMDIINVRLLSEASRGRVSAYIQGLIDAESDKQASNETKQ